mgnify:FL=1
MENKNHSANYKNILILDGLNIFVRSYSVDQTLTLDNIHCGGITGFINCTRSWITKFNPDAVFICWDGAGGSQHKRSIYKDYKQNRKPLFDKNSNDERDKNKLWQLATLIECLKFLPIQQLYADNCEADDIIFYIVSKLKETKKIIITSDKDMYQLIDKKTTVYSLAKKCFIDINYLLKEDNVHPTNYAMFKSLIGDKSDNIDGMKGIGPKRAVQLFPFLNEDIKHEINDIKAVINNNSDVRYNAINENIDKLERNYSLIKLSYDHLSLNQINKIDEAITISRPLMNILEFRKFLLSKKINFQYIDNVLTAFRQIAVVNNEGK